MPPSSMDGIRSWKFEVDDVGIIELIDTDFWIDYAATGEGNEEPEKNLSLQSVWQHSDFSSAKGLARRVFMEDRLKELKWDFQNKKGTLTIDEGATEERIHLDITLRDVLTQVGDFNDLIEYTLVFGFPLSTNTGTGGLEIARKMRFVPHPHNLAADNEDYDSWIQNDSPTINANLNNDPEGNLTVDQILDTSNTLFQSVEQNAAIDGKLFQYEASIYIRKALAPGSFPGIRFAISGSTLIETQYTLDHTKVGGGLVLLRSGEIAADYAAFLDVAPDFYRIVLRLTNTDLANDTLELEILPGVALTFINTWSSSVDNGDVRLWRGHLGLADLQRDVGAPTKLTGATPGDLDSQSIIVAAENFVIEDTREDLTQFKEVFRSSPIRVFGSLGTEGISISGIKELTIGATNLEKRQDAHAKVQKWVDVIARDGVLIIDEDDANQEQVTAHLNSVTPDDLGLPDSVTYSLDLVADYEAGLT